MSKKLEDVTEVTVRRPKRAKLSEEETLKRMEAFDERKEEFRKVAALTSKGNLLEKAGYVYSFNRMVYFNPKARKVFSLEFVEDHSEAEVQRCICEDTGRDEWHFYFNSPPSEAVKRELASVLG
jgi:hypothetical protein